MVRENQSSNISAFKHRTREIKFCPKCKKTGWITFYQGASADLPRYYYLLPSVAVPCLCECGDIIQEMVYGDIYGRKKDNIDHMRRVASIQASRAYMHDKELINKSAVEISEMVDADLIECRER